MAMEACEWVPIRCDKGPIAAIKLRRKEKANNIAKVLGQPKALGKMRSDGFATS